MGKIATTLLSAPTLSMLYPFSEMLQIQTSEASVSPTWAVFLFYIKINLPFTSDMELQHLSVQEELPYYYYFFLKILYLEIIPNLKKNYKNRKNT